MTEEFFRSNAAKYCLVIINKKVYALNHNTSNWLKTDKYKEFEKEAKKVEEIFQLEGRDITDLCKKVYPNTKDLEATMELEDYYIGKYKKKYVSSFF